MPIVIAYHLIWTAYGWWLANDPRGSMSEIIRCDVFKDLGELHYGRKRAQPAGWVIHEFYREAAKRLKHTLLTFDEHACAEIAAAFNQVIQREKLTVYACAIMPEHIHLVVRKHRLKAEEMIELFQEESRLRLRVDQPWTFDHPVWGGPGWVVFLDHPDEVERTNQYVADNPKKLGLPQQPWPFVAPYDRWPLHAGHSINSPYVKRLKSVGRYP